MNAKGVMMTKEANGGAPSKIETTDEGARGFSVFLASIGEGQLHAELSETLRDSVKQLEAHALDFGKAKGELNLKLKISIDREGGMVVIAPEVTTKIPKPARRAGVFWVDKTGNLIAENPRNKQLPLRAVNPAPVAEVATPEPAAPRSV